MPLINIAHNKKKMYFAFWRKCLFKFHFSFLILKSTIPFLRSGWLSWLEYMAWILNRNKDIDTFCTLPIVLIIRTIGYENSRISRFLFSFQFIVKFTNFGKIKSIQIFYLNRLDFSLLLQKENSTRFLSSNYMNCIW